MIRKRSILGFTLLLSGALAAGGCNGDEDDGGTDARPDTGVTDTGTTDTGVDTGVVDTGVDTGVVDTGVDNCLTNDTVDVDGTGVMVDPASEPPLTGGSIDAVLSCSRPPPNPPFADDYCLVECVDFLGYDPSPNEVNQIELAVFPLFDVGTQLPIDSDPTFDHNTGVDRDPAHRLPIGFVLAQTNDPECPSGYQLEMGFTGGPGAGDQTLKAETPYVIRLRSVQTASAAWAETYYWQFIRRNDETPDVPACGINEARTPGTRYVFPIVHRSLLEQAIGNAAVAVPGSADLDDGLGSGYALMEARDCSSGGGLPMENATLGMTPAPLYDVYPGDMFQLDRTALFTSQLGQWFAIGFDEMTGTSSTASTVTSAVGVTSDGTCTEAFAGSALPIYPDAVTYFRFSRESSL